MSVLTHTVNDEHAITSSHVFGYALTEHARAQMDDQEIDMIEVASCLENPTEETNSSAIHSSYRRGDIGVYTNEKTHTVLAVVRQDVITQLAQELKNLPVQPAQPRPVVHHPRRTHTRTHEPETRAGFLHRMNVLDTIHPALRAEVTRQVDGDFSRIVVHSPMKVTINPPR